jgi:hypothetical protein
MMAALHVLLPAQKLRSPEQPTHLKHALTPPLSFQLILASSSVRTLVEQIQLFSGIDIVLSGANLRKQHIQWGLLEHG